VATWSETAAVNDNGDSGGRKKGTALLADIQDQVRHLIETKPEMSDPAIAAIVGVRTDAGISDAFGSSTLKAYRPVHSR
jgi:hypothetical protein